MGDSAALPMLLGLVEQLVEANEAEGARYPSLTSASTHVHSPMTDRAA